MRRPEASIFSFKLTASNKIFWKYSVNLYGSIAGLKSETASHIRNEAE